MFYCRDKLFYKSNPVCRNFTTQLTLIFIFLQSHRWRTLFSYSGGLLSLGFIDHQGQSKNGAIRFQTAQW